MPLLDQAPFFAKCLFLGPSSSLIYRDSVNIWMNEWENTYMKRTRAVYNLLRNPLSPFSPNPHHHLLPCLSKWGKDALSGKTQNLKKFWVWLPDLKMIKKTHEAVSSALWGWRKLMLIILCVLSTWDAQSCSLSKRPVGFMYLLVGFLDVMLDFRAAGCCCLVR